jgi:hypothetical protein
MLGADADDIDAVVGHVRRGQGDMKRGKKGILCINGIHMSLIYSCFLSSAGRDP